jgi:hypothetical protein
VTEGEDEPPWSLEADIRPEGWDNALQGALRQLHQGCLVRYPPIVYYALPGQPLTHTTARFGAVKETPGPVAPRSRPPWGIITTQTCDLIEEGRPKRPWFSVAPVYVYECDSGLARQIRNRCFSYLFAVTTLGPAAGGIWVADLRLEVPVEKSWLVGCVSQAAFATQPEYWSFSMHLGELRTRFAYPRDIDELFLAPCLAKLKMLSARYPSGFEARFRVGKNSEDPQTVGLVLMFDEEPPAGLCEEMNEWWVNTFQNGSLGFHVVEPVIMRITDVDPRDFEVMRSFASAATAS